MLLHRLARRYRFCLREVDITGDPALVRAYDVVIPVVVIDGTTELHAPISESALRAALR